MCRSGSHPLLRKLPSCFGIVGAVVVLWSLSGCSYYTQPKKTQASEYDSSHASYFDRSKGFHRISRYFGYMFDGKPNRKWRVTFHHIDDGEELPGRKLGTLCVGYPPSGSPIELHPKGWAPDPIFSRESLYAISPDGETLLYIRGGCGDSDTGLYEFVHGRGDRMVEAVHKPYFGEIDLPMDEICIESYRRFWTDPQWRVGQVYVLSTSGGIIPWVYYDGPELHRAAATGDLDEVKRLLATGGSVDPLDSVGKAPLQVAIEFSGDQEIISLLIERGANVNIHRNTGGPDNNQTPLQAALVCHHDGTPEIVRQLIAAGAKVNTCLETEVEINGDKVLTTPLLDAVSWRGPAHPEVVEALISAGAEVNPKCTQNSPLHYAVRYRSNPLSVVRMLLDAGADVNSRNWEGETPLHLTKDPAKIDLLLKYGADPGIKNDRGDLPPYLREKE